MRYFVYHCSILSINIGETFRRIIGKAVSWVLKSDIQEAAGPLQVCTGLKSGAEAAVHYMREQFQLETTEAVILVDASNAFNSVNRAALLHNIQIICPEFSTIAVNMYRTDCRLFVSGTEIASSEGTTQGDNLAMSLFAMATLPVLRWLQQHTAVHQVWLADDATGAGDLKSLPKWWLDIVSEGEKYGYYVNAAKSCLVLKSSDLLREASHLFGETEITLKTDGQRHLEAVLGGEEFQVSYIKHLVEEWGSMLKNLVEYAKSQPHAAYASFTHGVRHKFTYFMRTMEISNYLAPLDELLTRDFIPTLFGGPISPIERESIALPVKYGGLGIPILTELAKKEYCTSLIVTQHTVTAMKFQSDHQITDVEEKLKFELKLVLEKRIAEYTEHQSDILK